MHRRLKPSRAQTRQLDGPGQAQARAAQASSLNADTNEIPAPGPALDRWVEAQRPARAPVDPNRPYGFFVEIERSASGEVESGATILLINRECPWRCVMCDLWKHTTQQPVPGGAIPGQIRYALDQLQAQAQPQLRWIKLYNSGSFFDPKAIPPADYPAIAHILNTGCGQGTPFSRVIVECHPALVGQRVLRFRDVLAGRLEVAMGLETAHPQVLARLNKRMTLDMFARASAFLRGAGVDLRAFVLVQPPFLAEAEALEWTQRSIEFAFACGASVVCLIPTRPGNGALEALAVRGQFKPPSLGMLEQALDWGVRYGRGRVFADLWDLHRFNRCTTCFEPRRQRLAHINATQQPAPPVRCPVCSSASGTAE